jgi:hypothetical protein
VASQLLFRKLGGMGNETATCSLVLYYACARAKTMGQADIWGTPGIDLKDGCQTSSRTCRVRMVPSNRHVGAKFRIGAMSCLEKRQHEEEHLQDSTCDLRSGRREGRVPAPSVVRWSRV